MVPTLYADLPARRTAQVLADLLALAGVLVAVWVGSLVDAGVDAVAAPVLRAESAGRSLSTGLTDAGDRLGEVPLVGDEVRTPLDEAAEASDGLAATAAEAARRIDVLGTWLGVGTTVLLLAAAAPHHLLRRARFVRQATAVKRLRAAGAGREDDLLALRALVHQPLHVLARRAPDAADGWRRRDAATVHALADLELRAAGLAPRRRRDDP